jgi:antitoxin (DNA-binding transcriptional repressor) of toxin-antitoxin stability system
VVTERGREVARLLPSGPTVMAYGELAARFGATVPVARLEDIAARLPNGPSPAGTTDGLLAEGRADRVPERCPASTWTRAPSGACSSPSPTVPARSSPGACARYTSCASS